MKRNQSIELLKLISALFIVVGHTEFAYYFGFGFAMDTIARFTVPIFFMTTGYFIIKPNNNTSVKLKKQIIKLIKYYILYEFVYILYVFITESAAHNFQDFENYFIINLKYILIAPTIGEHLWYVINIAWVLAIINFFNYFDKLKLLFIISIILHLTGILISHLSVQLFHRVLPMYMTRNFLFFGLFYVMLGLYISKVDLNKIKFNNIIILVFSIFMCLSQLAERYLWIKLFNSNFAEYYITTLFASATIFIFVLKSTVNNGIVEKFTRYSMPIYFLHILIIRILGLLSTHVLHVDLNVLRTTLILNIAFVPMVCILSAILYNISKTILQALSSKILNTIKATT